MLPVLLPFEEHGFQLRLAVGDGLEVEPSLHCRTGPLLLLLRLVDAEHEAMFHDMKQGTLPRFCHVLRHVLKDSKLRQNSLKVHVGQRGEQNYWHVVVDKVAVASQPKTPKISPSRIFSNLFAALLHELSREQLATSYLFLARVLMIHFGAKLDGMTPSSSKRCPAVIGIRCRMSRSSID